jgi:multidrug efflux pump subunit AcrB
MIRAFLQFAIDRPVLNHIVLLLLLIVSVFAYRTISKEIFPPSTLDAVTISGGYPGASAEHLDKMVVTPLEEKLKTIDDIYHLNSVIQNGSFSIRADLKEGSDRQLILGRTKDAIASIRHNLPADMNEPVARILTYQIPLMTVSIGGGTDVRQRLEVARELKTRLSTIGQLSQIQIRGDTENEVRILVDEHKLDAYRIPKQLFYRAVGQLSSLYPIGTIRQNGHRLYLSTRNGAKTAHELGESLIGIGERHVRLKDVAQIVYRLKQSAVLSHFNGKRDVSLSIAKGKEGNAIALSRQVRSVLDHYRRIHPDMTFEVYLDTSEWIRSRINLVTSNIFFGLILVFGAMFLSMNWRIATVVGMGIPTSFFLAVILAYFMGMSINLLSMLGTLIALGMIVDEAIVVAENIFRHMEMGKPPKEAAIEGAAEMFPAVLTATATTVFAFLPLLIVSGNLGMFVKVLPVTIVILLLSSLFEAFYFLPLHAKELFTLGHRIDHHEPSRLWDTMGDRYTALLRYLLRHKRQALPLLVAAILLSTYGMIRLTKFELFPPFDGTQVYFSGKTSIHSDLNQTEAAVQQIERIVLRSVREANVASVSSLIGMRINPDNTVDTGNHIFQIVINLRERKPENFFDRYINPHLMLESYEPDARRSEDAHDLVARYNRQILPQLKALKDAHGNPPFHELGFRVPQTGLVRHDIEIGLGGADAASVFAAVKQLQKALREINGTHHILSNAVLGPETLTCTLNTYGQQLGFTESYLIETLRGLYLEAEYGKLFDEKGLIRLRLQSDDKHSVEEIGALRIRTPDGSRSVRMGEIVRFVRHKRMLHLYKEHGERIWSVSASVDKHTILPTEVMDKLRPLLHRFASQGIIVRIKGEEKADSQIESELSEAAIVALFLIFIALVWMFNSFGQSLIVLSAIPLSLLGALVGTYLFGFHMTMIGAAGIIGLTGVVVNDGLIMIDFLRRSTTHEGIVREARLRLRPVMLTSVTTVLGLSTLIFFASGQSIIVQPMAIALGFGIAWATVINLLYIPLVYSVFYRIETDR